MIYQFKITSQESFNFTIEIEADGKHTFYDLHKLIQKNLGFESHQLASFFISDGNWRKLKEISMLDIGMGASAYHIMQKTKLADLINQATQKLIYTFDFFNDRSLFIELTGKIMEKNLNEPLVTQRKGDTPVQILGEHFIEQESANLQEEEVFMDFGEVDDYTELYGEMEDF
ncbi:MAG TPA: hypothetical protein VKA10_01730 [Prolixibacteraceae bacterium]|nr:hypothetical protein [Prolixibacteraceae bacterium]